MNWDLSSYFKEFGSKEMLDFKDKLFKSILALTKKAAHLSVLDSKNAKDWEDIILKCEKLLDMMSHFGSYIGCLSSIDARNEEYQKETASMSVMDSEFVKLEVELLRAFKSVKDADFKAFIKREKLNGLEYYLSRLKTRSQYTMNKEKEMLAADLYVDGVNAWGRLYDTISGKLEFDMTYPDGKTERLSISQRRSLMDDPDRRIRKAAFDGGNKAWNGVEDVAAAALNAIAGTRLTLNKHRSVKHFLDVPLFQSAMSKKTLTTMFDVIYQMKEIPLNILKLKSKTMKTKGIAWYDLGASLNIKDQERISWEAGKKMVFEAFGRRYPALAEFLKECFEKRWIEYEPRPAKRPGAFCTGSLLTRESRVFMTYKGSIGDILTLAHEVGHAFHSRVLKDVRSFSHLYPMTLAETASTFGEKLLMDGLLEDKTITDSQKAIILDMEVNHGAIYLLDIFVRFEFEKAFYEQRAKGELSVSQLKDLMLKTQRNVFGNILQKNGEDPYFWISKLHFYIPDVEFYNFPYTFGYLLSRGLYMMFKKEGSSFLPKYEKFLGYTGSDTAENVAKKTIGIDLEKPDFWIESVKSLIEPLEILRKLIPKLEFAD